MAKPALLSRGPHVAIGTSCQRFPGYGILKFPCSRVHFHNRKLPSAALKVSPRNYEKRKDRKRNESLVLHSRSKYLIFGFQISPPAETCAVLHGKRRDFPVCPNYYESSSFLVARFRFGGRFLSTLSNTRNCEDTTNKKMKNKSHLLRIRKGDMCFFRFKALAKGTKNKTKKKGSATFFSACFRTRKLNIQV